LIEGLDDAAQTEQVEIFHAGTMTKNGDDIYANGGRVLNVCARGKTVREAQHRAYAAVDKIKWPGGFLSPRHRLASNRARKINST